MSVLPVNLGLLLIFALVGLAAGGIRAAQRVAPRAGLRDVLTQGLGGAITSFFAGAVCLYWWGEKQPYLSLVISLIAGWIGTILMDKAGAVLVSQAEKKFPTPPTKDAS